MRALGNILEPEHEDFMEDYERSRAAHKKYIPRNTFTL